MPVEAVDLELVEAEVVAEELEVVAESQLAVGVVEVVVPEEVEGLVVALVAEVEVVVVQVVEAEPAVVQVVAVVLQH